MGDPHRLKHVLDGALPRRHDAYINPGQLRDPSVRVLRWRRGESARTALAQGGERQRGRRHQLRTGTGCTGSSAALKLPRVPIWRALAMTCSSTGRSALSTQCMHATGHASIAVWI